MAGGGSLVDSSAAVEVATVFNGNAGENPPSQDLQGASQMLPIHIPEGPDVVRPGLLDPPAPTPRPELPARWRPSLLEIHEGTTQGEAWCFGPMDHRTVSVVRVLRSPLDHPSRESRLVRLSFD
jgi:hypothetical protein